MRRCVVSPCRGRTFFGRDTVDLATKFVGAVADKTLTGVATGAIAGAGAKATLTTAAAASAANAGWVGALATGGVIGAGAGLIIGVIAHAGKTYHEQRKRAENSPYRGGNVKLRLILPNYMRILDTSLLKVAAARSLRSVIRIPIRISRRFTTI